MDREIIVCSECENIFTRAKPYNRREQRFSLICSDCGAVGAWALGNSVNKTLGPFSFYRGVECRQLEKSKYEFTITSVGPFDHIEFSWDAYNIKLNEGDSRTLIGDAIKTTDIYGVTNSEKIKIEKFDRPTEE